MTDPAQAADVHVADSLVGLEVEELRAATRIADLGAGAGFPGLVLAAALPVARVALVESVGRKANFLRRAAEAMELANARVVAERAEGWREGLGVQDIVTVRALAPLNVLVEYAAPLLREGGVLVAWKGRREASGERDGLVAGRRLGMGVEEVRPVGPWAAAEARHLHVVRKVAPTRAGFPRGPGMARKKPLR